MATLNQKIVFEKVKNQVVKGKKISVSKEMKGVYADSTAKRPDKLTKSKGWEELMNDFLPDNKLAKTHKAILDKKEIILKNNNKTGNIEKITTGQPHSDVNKALDMAYKLKAKYPAEKHDITSGGKALQKLSEEEVNKLIDIYESRGKSKVGNGNNE